jgi:hypothetical protein
MVSISRSIFPTCGMTDIEHPMIHIRLYREGGRYVESANNKKKEKKERKKGIQKKEKRTQKEHKKKKKEKEKAHVQ